MARFCASLHDRRRSRPVIICTLAISMSLALLQAPQLALVRTSGLNCGADARRPSPEAYRGSVARRAVPAIPQRDVARGASARNTKSESGTFAGIGTTLSSILGLSQLDSPGVSDAGAYPRRRW